MINKIKPLIIPAIIALVLVIALLIIMKYKSNIQGKDLVNVYFSKVVGSDVILEAVKRKVKPDEYPLKLAMDQLLAGPTKEEKDKGFYTEIPVGTRVIDINKSSDQVQINLNDQFVSGGGANSIVTRLNQVIDTALSSEPVRKVYLNVNGRPLETLGEEGLEVTQPLEKTNLSANNSD